MFATALRAAVVTMIALAAAGDASAADSAALRDGGGETCERWRMGLSTIYNPAPCLPNNRRRPL
jgi:hypothetical protein